jgi:hypothetical protein
MEPTNRLEELAASGDPGGMFDLALQLLSGEDSSRQLQRSISLVEESSNAGHSPATELWAIFEAMGVSRPQDWDAAFDRLRLAAEQGSVSAQRQLLILTRWNEGDATDDWAQVRASISLSDLLAHGERISLSDAPRIRVIPGFANPAECAWLIDRARSRIKPAVVIDANGIQAADPARTNSSAEFLVQDMDLVLEIVRNRISAATRIPVPVFEPTQLLHYNVGEEFKLHHDFLDPTNPNHGNFLEYGQRIATFLIYLNEEFEGGETQFPQVGIEFRGKTGDAIFWANLDRESRPDPLTLHAGLAPTSGEKWILSQWIRDRTPARS